MHVTTLTLILFAATAYTQSISSTGTAIAGAPTGNMTPCILQCATIAATSAGCRSPTDLACICSATVHDAALRCLQDACSASDVAAGQEIQRRLCASQSSGTDSGSASATDSSTSLVSAFASITSLVSALPASSTSTSTTLVSSVSTPTSSPTSSSRPAGTSAFSKASSAASTISAATSRAASNAKKDVLGMGGVWAVVVAVGGGAMGAFVL